MGLEQERKAGNARRRMVDQILQRCAKPDSKSTIRRRFEAAHDEWRTVMGFQPLVRNSSGKPIGYRVSPF